MEPRVVNRVLGLVAVAVFVATGVGVAVGHHGSAASPPGNSAHGSVATPESSPGAGAARTALEGPRWRLVAVVENGRRMPVDPAFGFAPATLAFGTSGFSGNDTCSPYQGAARIETATIDITGVDRGASTCGGTSLPSTADPIFFMRQVLETKGTVTWRLTGTTGLTIERHHAPTLVLVQYTQPLPSTASAPVNRVSRNDWVPNSLIVKGAPTKLVQNTLTDGALVFDGKGRFHVDDGCNGIAGTVTVGRSAMDFTIGMSTLVLCSEIQPPNEIDRRDAAARVLFSNGKPVSWELSGNVLTLTSADGTTLTFKPPRLGFPPWSATQVSSGTIAGRPYRVGVVSVDRPIGVPPAQRRGALTSMDSITSVEVIVQMLDPTGHLVVSSAAGSDTLDARQFPITTTLATIDATHHALLGLVRPAIAKVLFTPAGGQPRDAPVTVVPGPSGFRWFLIEVPTVKGSVVGYDANGFQVATLEDPARGFSITR